MSERLSGASPEAEALPNLASICKELFHSAYTAHAIGEDVCSTIGIDGIGGLEIFHIGTEGEVRISVFRFTVGSLPVTDENWVNAVGGQFVPSFMLVSHSGGELSEADAFFVDESGYVISGSTGLPSEPEVIEQLIPQLDKKSILALDDKKQSSP